MHFLRDEVEFLLGRVAVRTALAGTVFDALQKTGNAHFDELIEIVGGDGEKLHALQERIGGIARFFQNAAVKLKPLHMAVQIIARIV